jgi:protein ImuB
MPSPLRTVVVSCPDWPVTAAGVAADVPAAVFSANRVVDCSAAARAEGVRRGHRRREAQSRCPELVVLHHDPDRDAREFDPVVSVVEALAPGVAVVHPGILALRARGPARYFGGEKQVVELLGAEVEIRLQQIGAAGISVGIADGLFTALMATTGNHVVPPGGNAEFLAPLDISALQTTGAAGAGSERDALIDLLRRLGLRTLGAFAALPTADIASRFDTGAVIGHRLAQGLDPYPVVGRTIPIDLEVSMHLDPPADQVDRAAFAARTLAEQLQERLAGHGLACTRLLVHATTTEGEEHSRSWRHDGALTAIGIADRTRWQLDGWLSGRASVRPTGGVSRLRLVAEEVIENKGFQLTLWGGWKDNDARVHRALTRVQGMLGPDAVLVPVIGGGRGPAERIRLVPWQDELTPAFPPGQPWPGQLPGPHPTILPTPIEPIELRDTNGIPVTVNSRQIISAPPKVVRRGGVDWTVLAWAGPWTLDERWWDPIAGRRLARLQVVIRHMASDTNKKRPDGQMVVPERPDGIPGTALLLVSESGVWGVEGVYG